MSFEIEGKLHAKYDINEVNDRFKKREFVLMTDEDGNYPQYVKMQLTQDRCSIIDPFEVGEQMKVFFDIRGNEYTNPKGEIIYFTNLNAWKVEKAGDSKPASGTLEDGSFPTANEEPISNDEIEDDLPF
ncbi:MAG: DUF3127 domain-containing protein [Bacteroidota bacterium]